MCIQCQNSRCSGCNGDYNIDYSLRNDSSTNNTTGIDWNDILNKPKCFPACGSLYSLSSPATVTVGGLVAGTVLTGMTLEEILEMILTPYLSPTFSSFDITQVDVEVGTTISGNKTFTWVTTNNSNIAANTIAIIDVTASNLLIGGLANSGSGVANIGVITKNTVFTYEWRGRLTDTQTNAIYSANTSVNWLWRTYIGNEINPTILNAEILTLDTTGLGQSQLATSINGTYSIGADTGYKYVCFPDSFTHPTSYTLGGFSLPMTDLGTQSVTNINGVVETYRIMRTVNILSGAVTIVIS